MDLVSRYYKTERRVFDILNAGLNLKPRPATLAMKKTGKKDLVVVEVGVYYGDNARSLLRTLDIKKLYLVDPYKTYTCANTEVKMDDKIFESAKKKLRPWEKKIEWIRKYSDEAVNDIPDADFIYLDANHDYEFIQKDLERYYRKVKAGGILGGHDMKIYHLGTIRAVIEFTILRDLKLNAAPDDYWFVK